MLAKIKAMWNLFRAGEAVADPAKWKSRQISATMIAAVIIGIVQLLKAFNVEIPIDNEAATAIGAGVVAAINIVLTITTSKAVGMRTNQPSMPSIQQATDESNRSEALPSEHVDNTPNGGIDEETRERAKRYVEQASANGLGRPEA